MTIKQKVHTSIYLTKDSQGNTASATCEEDCDQIQICGMVSYADQPVYFESDAYHLSSWCDDNNIELKVIKREEDFDDLWEIIL